MRKLYKYMIVVAVVFSMLIALTSYCCLINNSYAEGTGLETSHLECMCCAKESKSHTATDKTDCEFIHTLGMSAYEVFDSFKSKVLVYNFLDKRLSLNPKEVYLLADAVFLPSKYSLLINFKSTIPLYIKNSILLI